MADRLPTRRRISSLLSSTLIILVLCSLNSRVALSQSSEDQVAQHFHAGQDAMRHGDFARATEEFRKVLALAPNLLEAEVNLGLAYHSLAEYDLAVRHLTKALRERPNLLASNVIVGMDYLKIGFPDKAGPFLQRSLKLDPSNIEARQALALSYMAQENFGSAADEFRQLASLDPDKSEAWFKLGHQYLDLSARLAYRGAHLYRESAWGHRFLGDLLFQRNRWDEAAREYQKALSVDPKQSGLHTSLGQAYLHAGKLPEAEAEFHLELQLDSENELAWLGLAETALQQGQAAVALKNVTKVWEISPEFLALQREFPTIELSNNTATTLIAGVQSSSADDPAADDPAAHFLLASLYVAANETSDSESQWNVFHNAFVTWQTKSHNASRAGAEQGPCKSHDYSACADWLQKQKPPNNSQRLLLGKTRFFLREYESAADALAQVTGVNNQNAEASYWLARTYHELGAESYARLEESFPDSWRAHQLRAEGYALRQDLPDAVKEFQAAIQLHPDDSELREALGEVYLNNHSDEDAQRELEKALALDASRTRALYLLGRLYVQQRENDKALPYLQRAVRLQPDLAEAGELLGTIYVRLGRFTNAVPQLEKAAAFDHYGNVHYQMYLAYRKLGQAGLAQKALARSQELRRSSLEHDQALVMGAPQVDSDSQ